MLARTNFSTKYGVSHGSAHSEHGILHNVALTQRTQLAHNFISVSMPSKHSQNPKINWKRAAGSAQRVCIWCAGIVLASLHCASVYARTHAQLQTHTHIGWDRHEESLSFIADMAMAEIEVSTEATTSRVLVYARHFMGLFVNSLATTSSFYATSFKGTL